MRFNFKLSINLQSLLTNFWWEYYFTYKNIENRGIALSEHIYLNLKWHKILILNYTNTHKRNYYEYLNLLNRPNENLELYLQFAVAWTPFKMEENYRALSKMNYAILITSHILIRLLMQHYYFLLFIELRMRL